MISAFTRGAGQLVLGLNVLEQALGAAQCLVLGQEKGAVIMTAEHQGEIRQWLSGGMQMQKLGCRGRFKGPRPGHLMRGLQARLDS